MNESMHPTPRLLILPMATAMAMALAVAPAGCSKQSATSEPEAAAEARVVVATSPSKRMAVDRTVTAVGTLRGDVEVVVSTKLAGRVETIAVDWGAAIGAGEPLLQLETVDLALARDAAAAALRESLSKLGLSAPPGPDFDPATIPALRMARAELAHAENRLERARSLLDDPAKIVSVQDFEDLQNEHDVAKATLDAALLDVNALVATSATRRAQLDLAEQKLSDSVVRAPALPANAHFRVAERLVEVGEYLKEGAPVFRLVIDDPLRFQARIPERLASGVVVGQEVAVRPDRGDDRGDSGDPAPAHAGHAGQVSRVAPAADPQTRTVLVEVRVQNADRTLVPGTFARGDVRVRRDEDVLFVPIDALVRSAGVTRVFTVENGAAVGHEVELGERHEDSIEILRGLDGTPDVVTSGASRITSGTLVEKKAAAELGLPSPPRSP